MGGYLSDEFSFRTGALRRRDLGYLLAENDELAEDEVPHTAIFEWDPHDEWRGDDLSWTATSACVCKLPKEQLVAVGRSGKFLVYGQGDFLEGHVAGEQGAGDNLASLRGVRDINGKAYAVGMDSQVYRRDGLMQWTRIDKGIFDSIDFEAIHGFAEDDMYAVGWKGAMWRYDGKTWSPINSPTNLILTSVCCAGDRNVYCAGQVGTLIVGRENQWHIIEHGETEEDFWDLEWFAGKLYLSTTRFLYTLEGNTLRLVKFGEDPPLTCYHLSATDDLLWSIGQKDVMAFDGASWTRID